MTSTWILLYLAGVKIEACIACARIYEADQQLLEMDIDVKGMGVPLSNY